MANDNDPAKGRPGIGVDAKGNAVVDPTANVIALNEASDRRQDDLRVSTEKTIEIQFQHVEEMAQLRDAHAKEIRELESRRLDAIRQVDVTATATAADRAASAIETLAKQTTADRETLRTAVDSSARALASQNSETVAQLVGRITALELAISRTTGKEAVSDPMLSQMVTELKALRTEMSTSTGKTEGVDKTWAMILALAGAGGGAGLMALLGR